MTNTLAETVNNLINHYEPATYRETNNPDCYWIPEYDYQATKEAIRQLLDIIVEKDTRLNEAHKWLKKFLEHEKWELSEAMAERAAINVRDSIDSTNGLIELVEGE